MNYIILGLPATGKTTICKAIAVKLNLTYINDYQILKASGISFENNSDILNNDYSKYIIDYLIGKDDLVVDLQYTLKPNQTKCINAIVYYIGFADIEPEVLKSILNKKDSSVSLDTAKLFIDKSKDMKRLCKQENVSYIEVDENRDKLIDKLLSEIITTKKD